MDGGLLCTGLQPTPVEILQWVVMRWSVKVTFEEAQANLGFETQRQWLDKGHCTHLTRPVGAVLARHPAGLAVKLGRADPRAGNDLVSQSRANFRGLFCLGASASLACQVF